jgi:LysR family glycine cleavage system transcriptional activator
MRFTDANPLMGAAVTGEGIALERRSVTRSDIPAGRLVRLFEHSFARFLLPLCGLSDLFGVQPALVAFRDWLIEEARRT